MLYPAAFFFFRRNQPFETNLGYVSVTVGGLLLNLASQSRSWITVLAVSVIVGGA